MLAGKARVHSVKSPEWGFDDVVDLESRCLVCGDVIVEVDEMDEGEVDEVRDGGRRRGKGHSSLEGPNREGL